MSTGRLEAFSDAVIAILMTIMVLELRAPHHSDLAALRPLVPVFFAYALSFVYLGIYWNNHHHMLQATDRITGGVLWANLHLLFWLSLFPFTTAWMSENHFARLPTAVYGVDLLLAAIAYYVLQTVIIRGQGAGSRLAAAIGRDGKGKASPLIYSVAVAMAFVSRWVAVALYVVVSVLWLIPDRRVERMLSPQSSITAGSRPRGG